MINYNTPSAGLKYPLEQITVSVSGLDLKKLNTSPLQILPLGFNYDVINVYLNYDCFSCNTSVDLFIGYESLLAADLLSSFCSFDTIWLNSNFGTIGLGTRVINHLPSGTLNTQPLVIWQQSDDSGADYSIFELTVTYIKFP
jgi:hypothetical protein